MADEVKPTTSDIRWLIEAANQYSVFSDHKSHMIHLLVVALEIEMQTNLAALARITELEQRIGELKGADGREVRNHD